MPRLPLVEWNSSNMCFIMPAGMPTPLSMTSMTVCWFSASYRQTTRIRPVLRLDRVERVAQQIHQHLVHAVGIQRDGGMVRSTSATAITPFSLAVGGDQFQAFVDQHLRD